MTAARTSTWFRCFHPRPWARLRLVCFPHAGGTASAFRGWPDHLPTTVHQVAAQYPGRVERLAEPPVDSMDRLVDGVLVASDELAGLPLVLFGHSMGASVAYEVARGLERRGRPVEHLVVSGRPAPSRQRQGEVHLRDDDGLLDDVRRLGGTSPLLLADPDLRPLILPSLRADYRLIETYRPAGGPALTCPVTAMVGAEDTEVTEAEAAAWAEVTDGSFRLRVLPGGHLSMLTDPVPLIAELVDQLGVRPVRVTRWPSTP